MSAIEQAGRTRRELTLAPNYIVLALLLVFASGPLLVLAFNSLKTQAELGRNPLGPPQSFIWENFPKAWDMGNFAVTTRNSGILVVGTVIGVLLWLWGR
jgi:raffinose/stachyose/melibiose transport system permease protein